MSKGAGEFAQDRVHLGPCGYHRQMRGTSGPLDVIDSRKGYLEHVPIEEEKGGERLVLDGCCDVALGGEMGEKVPNLACT